MNVLLASIPVATLTLALALTKQQGRPSLSMCDSYQPCLDLLSSQDFEDALMIISGVKDVAVVPLLLHISSTLAFTFHCHCH